MDAVILTRGLEKTYGRTQALAGLDLEVRAGEVFGFLGVNGAGKTTTIRILLDLIRPTAGSVRVLGLDPRREGVALRRRLGYLEGEFSVEGRQTGHELLTHLGHLRGGVPSARITDLADRLQLDLTRPIGTLSKGNRQKVGLIQAFMHEPELLVLDEPTAGLDPFLQQEFVAMARAVVEQGRTVFMSSHVMSEVQKSADRVGIIRDGRLSGVDTVDSLRASAIRQVEVVFAARARTADFVGLPGVSDVRADGAVLHCRLEGPADALVKALAAHDVLSLTSEEPDLEDVFFDRYSGERPEVAS
ncbi:ABC transporter ATP-binding protein [uncultured Phycicoccus sp.]|uniref:ABC transporter ATP-binding protein n=1 Tax=uncultured Phycicoccus sp. TaxID=661422 RepID=UPI00261E7099|nr:ABC transporter ATP-binding protein [uncultured Phycicoccus sp.]